MKQKTKGKQLFCLLLSMAMVLALPCWALAIEFNAEQTYLSVFVITSGNSLGSGFALGSNLVVTNAHVVENSHHIRLETFSGETYSATPLGIDQDKDIALLQVSGANFTPLETADYKAMNVGDDVYAIGAPKSMAYTLTKGVLSAKERKVGNYYYIQTDAAINHSNSGGPLLNAKGQVIGMNTLKMSDSEGIGLAIPMADVTAFMNNLHPDTSSSNNTVSSAPQEPTVTPGNTTGGFFRPNNSSLYLLGGLVISMGLNIILLALYLAQRRKNKRPPSGGNMAMPLPMNQAIYHPDDEDIDIEIDILE